MLQHQLQSSLGIQNNSEASEVLFFFFFPLSLLTCIMLERRQADLIFDAFWLSETPLTGSFYKPTVLPQICNVSQRCHHQKFHYKCEEQGPLFSSQFNIASFLDEQDINKLGTKIRKFLLFLYLSFDQLHKVFCTDYP